MNKDEKTSFPLLLSAKDLQKMGISRSMSYQILNRSDLSVIKIGERKMIKRDEFLAWLDRCTVGATER